MSEKDKVLSKIVHERLIVQAKCYRHCDRDASFHELDSGGKGVVGLYVCPSGYVSRVIYFDQEPDIEWYKGFLRAKISGMRVEGKDLRIATRHPWDLGLKEAEVAIGEGSLAPYVLREVYWSPPRTEKSGLPVGAFLCSRCDRIFAQDIKSTNRLCPSCSGR